MPIIEENGKLTWLEEAQTKVLDKKLWQKARQLARLDKDYNPFVAKIMAKRIYAMLGGQLAPKRSGKDKGKARKIRATKPSKAKKSTRKK